MSLKNAAQQCSQVEQPESRKFGAKESSAERYIKQINFHQAETISNNCYSLHIVQDNSDSDSSQTVDQEDSDVFFDVMSVSRFAYTSGSQSRLEVDE